MITLLVPLGPPSGPEFCEFVGPICGTKIGPKNGTAKWSLSRIPIRIVFRVPDFGPKFGPQNWYQNWSPKQAQQLSDGWPQSDPIGP